MTRYISLADTNKAIRAALKDKFPGVKFSVRGKSYSGGASTSIYWTNGPTSRQVNEVVSHFEGATFDGMIDLKSTRYAMENGERVHYGADYIFTHREVTPEFVESCKAAYEALDPTDQCKLLNKERSIWANHNRFGGATGPIEVDYRQLAHVLPA